MSKRTLTTTLSIHNLVARRTTERNYTHVVWIQEPKERILQRLEKDLAHYRKQVARYSVPFEESPEAKRPEYSSFYTREWHEEQRQEFESRIPKVEAEIAEACDSEYEAVAWCGREDLARKEANKYLEYGFQVQITEVAK
jgi:hypothetical protein